MKPPRLPVIARANPPQTSKIGDISKATDRTQAQAPALQARTGAGETRTQIYTYITKAPVIGESTPVLYNGDRIWARITLVLETAGPVAIGTDSKLTPVLSGKGALLTTNVPQTITIAKGSRLYISSPGANRVRVEIAAVPWLEQIAAGVLGIFQRLLTR